MKKCIDKHRAKSKIPSITLTINKIELSHTYKIHHSYL